MDTDMIISRYRLDMYSVISLTCSAAEGVTMRVVRMNYAQNACVQHSKIGDLETTDPDQPSTHKSQSPMHQTLIPRNAITVNQLLTPSVCLRKIQLLDPVRTTRTYS